jgi:hypothetical protein
MLPGLPVAARVGARTMAGGDGTVHGCGLKPLPLLPLAYAMRHQRSRFGGSATGHRRRKPRWFRGTFAFGSAELIRRGRDATGARPAPATRSWPGTHKVWSSRHTQLDLAYPRSRHAETAEPGWRVATPERARPRDGPPGRPVLRSPELRVPRRLCSSPRGSFLRVFR